MKKVTHDSETLATGQQVITACTFIYRLVDGVPQVFLPRRADTKKFLPGKYELPGGHIDFGENIVAGLRREIMEEFGVEVTIGDPFAVFTYVNNIKQSHSIEVVYFAQLTGDREITIHPDDHSSYGWFAEAEAVVINGDEKDDEIAVIEKGFALLRGESLKFS